MCPRPNHGNKIRSWEDPGRRISAPGLCKSVPYVEAQKLLGSQNTTENVTVMRVPLGRFIVEVLPQVTETAIVRIHLFWYTPTEGVVMTLLFNTVYE